MSNYGRSRRVTSENPSVQTRVVGEGSRRTQRWRRGPRWSAESDARFWHGCALKERRAGPFRNEVHIRALKCQRNNSRGSECVFWKGYHWRHLNSLCTLDALGLGYTGFPDVLLPQIVGRRSDGEVNLSSDGWVMWVFVGQETSIKNPNRAVFLLNLWLLSTSHWAPSPLVPIEHAVLSLCGNNGGRFNYLQWIAILKQFSDVC